MGAEVRVKLVGDDAASAVVEKLKGKIGEAKHAAHEFGRSLFEAGKDFASQMAHMAGFSGIAGGLGGLAESAVEAARAAKSQEMAIAGALAKTDQTGASFMELREKAHGMREEFVEMAMKSGVMASDVVNAFSDIAERSGKSTGAVKELTQQILQAGRVTGDTESLTRGMRMLEAGMVSARNPIVAMIRSTGVLHGSIHEVAQTLGHLKPEDQIKAGEEAIRRLADKAKGMEPTFGQLANNMRQIKENVLEDIGGPLIKGIMPALMEFQKWVNAHRADIERYAKTIGEKVGEWVKAAAKIIQEGFHWLETHAAEIKSALSFGANAIKTAIEFLLAHKEVIVGMLTVRGLPGGLGGLPGLGVAAATGGWAIGSEIGKAIFNAANKNTDTKSLDVITQTSEAAKRMAEKGDTEGIRKLFQEVAAEAKANNYKYDYQGRHFLENLEMIMRSHFARAGEVERAAKRQESIDQLTQFKAHAQAVQDAMQSSKKGMLEEGAGPRDVGADLDKAGQEAAALYNQAMALNSQYGKDYAVNMLVTGKGIGEALINSGAEVAGGMEGLLANVEQASKDVADRLRKVFKEKQEAGGVKPMFQQNFSGGQTFHINQDFRHADDDNIALRFRRDLFKSTLARGMAKTGGPMAL